MRQSCNGVEEEGHTPSARPDSCQFLSFTCSARCEVSSAKGCAVSAACCWKAEKIDGAGGEMYMGRGCPLIFLPNTDRREIAGGDNKRVKANPAVTPDIN